MKHLKKIFGNKDKKKGDKNAIAQARGAQYVPYTPDDDNLVQDEEQIVGEGIKGKSNADAVAKAVGAEDIFDAPKPANYDNTREELSLEEIYEQFSRFQKNAALKDDTKIELAAALFTELKKSNSPWLELFATDEITNINDLNGLVQELALITGNAEKNKPNAPATAYNNLSALQEAGVNVSPHYGIPATGKGTAQSSPTQPSPGQGKYNAEGYGFIPGDGKKSDKTTPATENSYSVIPVNAVADYTLEEIYTLFSRCLMQPPEKKGEKIQDADRVAWAARQYEELKTAKNPFVDIIEIKLTESSNIADLKALVKDLYAKTNQAGKLAQANTSPQGVQYGAIGQVAPKANNRDSTAPPATQPGSYGLMPSKTKKKNATTTEYLSMPVEGGTPVSTTNTNNGAPPTVSSDYGLMPTGESKRTGNSSNTSGYGQRPTGAGMGKPVSSYNYIPANLPIAQYLDANSAYGDVPRSRLGTSTESTAQSSPTQPSTDQGKHNDGGYGFIPGAGKQTDPTTEAGKKESSPTTPSLALPSYPAPQPPSSPTAGSESTATPQYGFIPGKGLTKK